MAVNSADVPYQRDQVQPWVDEFHAQSVVTDMREWMTTKLGVDAGMLVNTTNGEVLLIDLLMSDMPSYQHP